MRGRNLTHDVGVHRSKKSSSIDSLFYFDEAQAVVGCDVRMCWMVGGFRALIGFG